MIKNNKKIKSTLLVILGHLCLLFSIFLFTTNNVFAELIINEIMYDPEGADTGREWIELFNNGDLEIDLSVYKIVENNINHTIKPIDGVGDGTSTILPKSYVVIVDNYEKFKIDFPNFNGVILDSAFSLNNTGEEIILKDGSGQTIDQITYNPETGANNNGHSLQKNLSGVWISNESTPGYANKNETAIVENNNEDDSSSGSSNSGSNSSSSSGSSNTSNSTHTETEELTDYEPSKPFEIGIGRNRIVTVRNKIPFKLFIDEENNKRLKHKKVYWNFGDGSDISYGKTPNHVFESEGLFSVVCVAENTQSEIAIARTNVNVIKPQLTISTSTDSATKQPVVIVENIGTNEINLSNWIIKIELNNSLDTSYEDLIVVKKILPDNTILQKNGRIQIPFTPTDNIDVGPNIDTEDIVSEMNRNKRLVFQKATILYPDGFVYSNLIQYPSNGILKQDIWQ